MNSEIILFEANDKSVSIPVKVDSETVWLNQSEMASLFSTTKQNVSLHVNNCFREKELDKKVVVKDFFTTTQHGAIYGKTQTRRTQYYNLDVIISVGYRVKSQRGVEFRQWANKVLKQYILQGYAVNDGEYENGVSSAGAPIYNSAGKIIAAINIVLPSFRFTGENRIKIIRLAMAGAAELSAANKK